MTHCSRRRFLEVFSGVPIAAQVLRRSESALDPASAMDALRAGIPVANADPDRPVYHFHPPANWTNDPNGTIFYKGWHHLFYQLNPTAPRPGNQHWGHARSRDLVNWEHLPIALWPLRDRGERAIFSGGAVLGPDGRPRVFYTSIGHASPEQWIAVPEDDELIRWNRPSINPILTVAAHGALSVSQWRDPFLFREGADTYMVCGGNVNDSRGGGGSVQLYRATNADLTAWQFHGVVFWYRDLAIYNVECPNLFPLDGKWVLLMSPQQPCEYFVGELDFRKPEFVPETHGVLDPGNSYASNISVDDKGRTILWLWGRTNTAPEKGWNGVMALPRLLSIGRDGFLRQQPAPEFESLRRAAVSLRALEVPVGSPRVLENVSGDCLELKAELVLGNASEIGLEFRRASDGKAGCAVRIVRPGTLWVGSTRAAITRGLERYDLRVFLDKRTIEVFVNDGEAAVYSTVDASPTDLAIAAVAQQSAGRGRSGGPPLSMPPQGRGTAPNPSLPARIEGLRMWPMRPATFSLDHFHL